MPSERSSHRRRRGSTTNPQPTRRRGRGSAANPAPAAPGRRGGLLRSGYSRVVHFDVPIAGGREIISIDWRGERTESGPSAPPIFVDRGIDRLYSTDSLPGRFDSIDQLLHAFGASWPSPCSIPPPSEHDLDGFQHLPFHDAATDAPLNAPVFPPPPNTPLYAHALSSTGSGWYAPTYLTQAQSYAPVFTPETDPVFDPTSTPAELSAQLSKVLAQCAPKWYIPPKSKKQHVDQPAWAHTQQKLDALSLEDSNYGPPGCRLSWSPIWKRGVFDWGITFYTTRDLTRSFRTYPDVGGPFQSLDEVNSAIDQYLIANEDPAMCAGLSQMDAMIKHERYYPDGTKKRGSIDKRRDKDYQLARALVDMYNDHHNLFGDLAYEVKDSLHGKPLWEDYIHWTYFHMNFTAKTKGSYGVDTGKLFFAEVTYKRGDDGLTVNSCCILEPSDHGLCYGCRCDMKHPNDGSVYAGGRRNISYCFQNGGPGLPRSYHKDVYNDDSDEEVERLRSKFMEYEEQFKQLPMPLEV